MNELSESDKALQKRMGIMLPLLNERQSRIYLGAEAESIGRGGISTVHKLSGANRRTIAAGVKEIVAGVKENYR